MRREFSLGSSGPIVKVRAKSWLEVDEEILVGKGHACLLPMKPDLSVLLPKPWGCRSGDLKDIEEHLKLTFVEKRQSKLLLLLDNIYCLVCNEIRYDVR
ncbi:hypothetical protein KI810_03020 [Geobacter luticola]|uniref:Uncharacterized protein n=1 Tax=Geomobilimonas luticola TaxID=1114878 RepID=A0ABS5S9F8_9BACT|nr:hypothetical protein [Geomobilimonas luticola]